MCVTQIQGLTSLTWHLFHFFIVIKVIASIGIFPRTTDNRVLEPPLALVITLYEQHVETRLLKVFTDSRSQLLSSQRFSLETQKDEEWLLEAETAGVPLSPEPWL